METSKNKLFSIFEIYERDVISHRFDFVFSNIKKENLVDSFIYMLFLLALSDKYEWDEPISTLLYKDIIVQAASILECILHDLSQNIHDAGMVTMEELGEYEYVYKDHHVLQSMPEFDVIGAKRIKKFKTIKHDTTFNDIILFLKKSGTLTEGDCLKCDKIRILRNRIHLNSLTKKEQSDTYNKECVESIFKDISHIISIAENYFQ